MKAAHVVGIVVAVVLICVGLFYPLPAKHLSVYGYGNYAWTENKGEEYVGGDAYNYQMEASLKAGYMAGLIAMKTINVVAGLLLLCLSLQAHARCNVLEQLGYRIATVDKSIGLQQQILTEIVTNTNKQIGAVENLIAVMDQTAPISAEEQDKRGE